MTQVPGVKPQFQNELETLINRHSMENGSNTADHVLAHFLACSLRAFDQATLLRSDYGSGICPNAILDVFEFNRRALGVGGKGVPHLDNKHARFCVKALREEAKELEDEHVGFVEGSDPPIELCSIDWTDPQSEEARQQTVKSVDALIDAAYFAIGGLARAGLTEAQALGCFAAVHKANMTKKLGVVASRGDMGVQDAVKPVSWVGPEAEIYSILFRTTGEPLGGTLSAAEPTETGT